ncbi:MAG: tetratricopeptide repeat protein [Acidobacteriota bacterium]|nr:tetratricopeptide repeat protein [Acidobacteriota bacterium]
MKTASTESQGLSQPILRALSLFLLIAAAVWVYWPALDFGTVNFDDPDYLEDNPVVLEGLTVEGLGWAFTTGHASNWHPLTWLSHMLDVELFGTAWGAHHGVNVALHVVSTLLLFLFWWRATGGWWRAVTVAALFALHPLHVESVAWLSERKDVLSGLLAWSMLLAYLGWARKPGAGRYALLLGVFAAGLMAKPMLVTLPCVLLLLDLWPLGRLSFEEEERLSLRFVAARVWPRVWEKLPLFALAAASAGVTVVVQRAGGTVSTLGNVPFLERLANALVTYAAYLGQMLWPVDLAALYPHPGMPSAGAILLAALVLGGISVGVAWRWRSQPFLLTGWLWYLGMLVPVVGLVQVGGQARADRYTYLPLVGVFVMVVWFVEVGGGSRLLGRLEGSGRTLAERSTAVAVLVLLAACSLQARQQVLVWQDSETLFRHALAVTDDNYLMANFLGITLMEDGALEEAEESLRQAVEIRPSFAEAHNNLGILAQRRGDMAQAAEHFRTAIGYDPEHADAHNNLANALGDLGRPQEALAHYRRALELEPDNASAEHNLGLTLAQAGRPTEAVEHFRAALRLDPQLLAARGDLANALFQLGRLPEAVEEYRQALSALAVAGASEGEDEAVRVRANLAQALAAAGRFDEARQEYGRLLALRPQDPRPRFYLALVEAASGNEAGVQEQLRWLERSAPEMAAEVRRRLGAALAPSGGE